MRYNLKNFNKIKIILGLVLIVFANIINHFWVLQKAKAMDQVGQNIKTINRIINSKWQGYVNTEMAVNFIVNLQDKKIHK